MSAINIQRVKTPGTETVPIFEEIAKRLDAVRRRAQELFENRGGELGRDWEDWFTAQGEIFGRTPAELSENEGAYEIESNLAGFDAKDVHVTATQNEIIVQAAAREERKGEKEKVLWSEFGSKDVCRLFELPSPIDTDKVTATLDKGVLHIKAPKGAAAQEKNIVVTTAA